MKLFFATVLLLLLSIFTLAKTDNECKLLTNCPSLYTLFAKFKPYTNIHQVYADYVRSLSCGFVNDKPKVYCPSEVLEKNFLRFWTDLKHTVDRDELRDAINIIRASNLTKLTSDALHSYDMPWLALLEYDTLNGQTKLMCGGSLIGPDVVLTAARCVSTSYKLINVHLGKYDLMCRGNTCNNISVPIASTIVHENYNADGVIPRNKNNTENDIAIIKLARKVDYNDYIRPISLPSGPPSNNTNYLVAGWSLTLNPSLAGLVLISKAELKDVGDACVNSGRLSFGTVEEHICVEKKNAGSLGPCVGDSGGPLMAYEVKAGTAVPKLVLYGVSALTQPCETVNFPYGLYTRVYNEPMLSWIKKFIE